MSQSLQPRNPLDCPVIYGLNLIDGKWKPIILHILLTSDLRFGQIKNAIPPISQKVLTQQLRELEQNNIVIRTITKGKILNVTYSLSELGQALLPVLGAIGEWGEKHKTDCQRF